MKSETEITRQHLQDLDERAFSRGYAVYSDFLNLDEISTLGNMKTKSAFLLYGGYDGAERCVAGFGAENSAAFPIVCLRLAPVSQKFSDALTHRDFLGALMHLGISRRTLGDILIRNNTGYLFCLESIADYIVRELTQVKHTTVSAEAVAALPLFINEKPDASALTVSSPRADAVVAGVYRLSRNAASQLFAAGKVFINARLCEKESAVLKEDDLVSVRGYGRFIYEGELRKTKKDRSVVSVRIYK